MPDTPASRARVRLGLAMTPLPIRVTSAASSYVCPVDDAAEAFIVGMVVAPDDVPADHAGLLLVARVVGAVEREVPQRGELRLRMRFSQDEFVGV
jgi:hypothetical protein